MLGAQAAQACSTGRAFVALAPGPAAGAAAAAAPDGSDSLAGDSALRRARQAMEGQMQQRMEDLQRRLMLAERALEDEQRRAALLAPYRVAAPKRGVMGNSRYAQQLRRAVVQASRDRSRRPVLIFGEPGLEKDNLAALIHFGSRNHAAPFVRLDCDRLDDDASELFGAGKKKGLLYWLPPEGTLLLNNIHKAPKAVLPLIKSTVDSVSRGSMDDGEAGSVFPRIILVSETALPEFAPLCSVIKVPPLRVRPSDIRTMQSYFLQRVAKQRGLPFIRLSDEAVRQLEAYSYPLNISELKTMVERAAAQSSPDAGNKINEEVFWFAKQAKDQLRYNLLKIPAVRSFLRSSLWPEDINHKFTVYAFAALVTLLFVGPQDRASNFGLNLFWCYWWPASFLVYPFLGRVWCAVCPFMIYGEIVQRWRVSRGAQLLKWPREQLDHWGPWFLFWLFVAILVWEEVWDLPDVAALSSWLLLLITAGAMIGSWFFERRIWCRYLCPIGGMNGLFAKLSMTELRARQGVCSSTCSTYSCYKGGPAVPPEGMETLGCPVYSHPAQLASNRDCVLCMECLKACPHRSIEFRLRLPGVDLWTTHKPLTAEVWLMFMLLGGIFLHDADDVLVQLGLQPELFLDDRLPHIITSAAFLAAPGVAAWAVDAAWRVCRYPASLALPTLPALLPALGGAGAGAAAAAAVRSEEKAAQARAIALLRAAPAANLDEQQRAAADAAAGAVEAVAADAAAAEAEYARLPPLRPFVELAYGYLPLVWAGTLAYYFDNLFEEAGLILPVAARTFGLDMPWLPTFVVDPVVTEFLQGSTLAFGALLSLVLTRKLGGRPWAELAPQCLLILAFTAELSYLIIPN
ncbi:ATPase AAA [Micractinium conductrix]|uniref:ATPase AAA n=1 Tax=Micractinium conductrix TaxID=554055 RepID=A0A2P6V7M6_9CHLO|nr:ATPase AAA [Micractinium conductrix]|eukprot:PSC70095.1 ATPase AAA [Micractinium conductrix]